MKIPKRLLAVVGAPALLAGLMLAGSAGVSPAAVRATPPDTIKFTATVITGGNAFTVNSTTCSLTNASMTTFPCRVSGAGTLSPEEGTASANLVVTGTFGPISLALTSSGECATGTGTVLLPSGPTPVNAFATVTNVTTVSPTMFTIKGQIRVHTGTIRGCDGGSA